MEIGDFKKIDDRISRIDIEYEYPGERVDVVRTVKVLVEGELKTEDARDLKEKVLCYFEGLQGPKKRFDKISIVARCRDWPARTAEATKQARERGILRARD